MGQYQFGTTNYMKSYTDQNVSKAGVPLPSGRAMANGSTNAAISALYMWVAGNGGARTGRLQLGNASTAAFTVGASTQAQPTGWIATNLWLVNGGTTTVGIYDFGQKYFGHNGTSWAAATMLAGYYEYVEGPTAPTMLSATPGPAGAVTVSFTGNGVDNGGTGITGWTLRYADNASMVGAVDVNSTGTTSLQLTPGKTYWFWSAARNWVTDASGTTGPWSAPISATMLSGGKIRSGGTWHNGLIKVRSGGTWHDGVIKVRAGGVWKDAQ